MKKTRKLSFTTPILFGVFALAILATVFIARRNRTDIDTAAAMREPLATPSLSGKTLPASSPSSFPTQYAATPTVDEVGTAYAVIAKDRATSTAESAKTSTAYAVEETESAQSTQAFWVGVTFAVGTEQATQTQVAGTKVVGTEQANFQTGVPLTGTVIGMTQIIESDQLNSTRAAIWIKNVGGTLVLFAFFGVLVFGIYKLILFGEERGKAAILKQKAEALKPDTNGRHSLLTSADLKPGEKLINADLMHRAALDPSRDDLNPEQALRNAQSARNLEGVRVLAPNAGKLAADMTQQMTNTATPTADVKISKPEEPKPAPVPVPLLQNRIPPLALPEWSALVNNWDGRQLPYGIGSNGLLTADPAEDPHLLIVGRTRTGKSRYGLRTVAASALTMGYQVLFVGKRVDFYPFEDHPNAKIIGVDLLNEPRKYLDVLRRVAGLMKERDDYLTNNRLSIWQQTGQPQLYVVLDEFSSAVRQLNAVKSGMGSTVSSIATALIQEGGKYGINVIQVVQDATGANVDISARRNMGKMVFRLSEPKASEIALGVREPSATELPLRHFFSIIGGSSDITLGAAFAPTDDDIQSFLLDRPVMEYEPMTWVDGAMEEDQPSVPTETPPTSTYPDPHNPEKKISAELHATYAAVDEELDIADKIRDAWFGVLNRREWKGWNAIEREVFGFAKNGSYQQKIKNRVAELEGITVAELAEHIEELVREWSTTTEGTTTPNSPEMPVLGANPA